MAHPMQEHRQHKIERNRVDALTKGYASGGAVHSDEAEDRKMVKGMVKPGALKIAGKKAGGRLDRYARGGGVKKAKGSTHVNVIVAPQHGGAAPMMPGGGGAMPMPPVMPPHPPMMPPGAGAPPGGMPSGLPPGPPPGMAPGPRRDGGRTFAKGGRANGGSAPNLSDTVDNHFNDWSKGNITTNQLKSRLTGLGLTSDRLDPRQAAGSTTVFGRDGKPIGNYAKGGRVPDGPAWKEGLRNGTHVQHTDGKNDQSGLGRGKPITYAKGGPVEAFGMGPKMTAGSGVEQGREQKIALQKRSKRP